MIDIKNKSGATILSVPVTENSLRKRQLMGDNNITLVFMLDEAVEIRKGYYIEFAGQKFEAMSDTKPEPDDATGGLKYTVRFDAIDGHMRRFNIFFRHDNIQEVSFALTGDLAAFAQIIADCMNFEMGGNSWTVNPPTIQGYKTISFFGEKVFDAATMIAEAFECEWWVVEGNGIKALHFGKLEIGTEETFSLDTVLASIRRNEGDKSKFGTRFYCFGGTRNLTPDYYNISQGGTTNHIAEVRLHLPNAQQYIDAIPNLEPEDVVHQVAIFDDIFPKNIDAITAIETAQRQFADGGDDYTAYIMTAAGTPFLPDDIIPGNTLMAVFDSGVLSGQEFELIINTTAFDKKFEIKAQVIGEGETAIVIPNPDFCPVVGDIFVLTGVKLPRSREIEAENELLAAGQAWATKNSKDTDVYHCGSNRVYCNQNGKTFEIGQRARLVDSTRSLDRSSRVIGYEKRLDDLFDAQYTVGDNTAYSRLAAIETSIKEAQYAERVGSEASAVNLIKSWENTKPNDYTAYSSRKADSYFVRSSRVNQQFGVAGLNQFGQIYDFLIPSHIKTMLEKAGSISGIYNVSGNIYNGIIADIIGDTTIGVTQPVTDQFEIVLYNHHNLEHTVTLGLNLWRDAEGDLVVGVIRGSAQAETITLQAGQIYRAKAFTTGQGLAIEANIVGATGPVDWTIIQNIPEATPYQKGIVQLGAVSGTASEGDHIHDDRYSLTSHNHDARYDSRYVKSYRHLQGTPATVWTIDHNLGRIPAIVVTDSAGTEVEGSISHPSNNQSIITFSAAFSGTADLN